MEHYSEISKIFLLVIIVCIFLIGLLFFIKLYPRTSVRRARKIMGESKVFIENRKDIPISKNCLQILALKNRKNSEEKKIFRWIICEEKFLEKKGKVKSLKNGVFLQYTPTHYYH